MVLGREVKSPLRSSSSKVMVAWTREKGMWGGRRERMRRRRERGRERDGEREEETSKQ